MNEQWDRPVLTYAEISPKATRFDTGLSAQTKQADPGSIHFACI